jgi:hypothetical protein
MRLDADLMRELDPFVWFGVGVMAVVAALFVADRLWRK